MFTSPLFVGLDQVLLQGAPARGAALKILISLFMSSLQRHKELSIVGRQSSPPRGRPELLLSNKSSCLLDDNTYLKFTEAKNEQPGIRLAYINIEIRRDHSQGWRSAILDCMHVDHPGRIIKSA